MSELLFKYHKLAIHLISFTVGVPQIKKKEEKNLRELQWLDKTYLAFINSWNVS